MVVRPNRSSHCHFCHHHAQTPNINRWSICGAAKQNFWSPIPQRDDSRRQLVVDGDYNSPREAKVGNLENFMVIHQDVLWFQVSVQNAVRVALGNTAQELKHECLQHEPNRQSKPRSYQQHTNTCLDFLERERFAQACAFSAAPSQRPTIHVVPKITPQPWKHEKHGSVLRDFDVKQPARQIVSLMTSVIPNSANNRWRSEHAWPRRTHTYRMTLLWSSSRRVDISRSAVGGTPSAPWWLSSIRFTTTARPVVLTVAENTVP